MSVDIRNATPRDRMADDEDSTSSSDDAGDPQTVVESEKDASFQSAVTDLSIMEGGNSNSSSNAEHNSDGDDDEDDEDEDEDDDEEEYYDCFDENTDEVKEYAEGMCNTVAGEENDETEEYKKEEISKENFEESLTFPKVRYNDNKDNSSKSPQVPVSPVSAEKLPRTYLGQHSANFAKLDHLSKTTCQDIMREILKYSNPRGKENQHLQDILKEWEQKLKKKRQGNKNHNLSNSDKALLFGTGVTYDKLDMTLMYKIAKNLLQDRILSSSCRSVGWDTDPPDYDMSLQACIEKLRKFRNGLAHSTDASFSVEATRIRFQHIRDVIVQVEKHIGIDPQYSLQVDFIQNAQLSPDVAELQVKLEELESERDTLKQAAKNEFDAVRQNLEECLGKYCDALGMFNKNVNGQDAQTRKCIENHEGSDRFYVETKASVEAMKVLESEHHVLITGSKGSGKTSLAYHLLYKLMPLGRCTVHVLDSLSDIRTLKINTDGFLIALIELNEITERQRTDLKFIIGELISKNTKLSLYLIMTTMSDNVDEITDLTTHVDLSSVLEFALDEKEKGSILQQQLKQVVKKTGVPLSHQPTKDELIDIVKEPSYPISFALAASLFAQNEKYRRLGPTFFRSPVDYFLSEIETLCKAKPTFLLLLSLFVENVTDSVNSVDIRNWITNPELDVDPKSTKKAGKRINGHLTLSCRSKSGFQLRNQCVRKAFAIYLAKKHLRNAIACLDQEYIVDTSILSCRTENTGKCVQLISEETDKKLLAGRYFREILADKTSHLSKSDAWLDDTFVEIFIEALEQHIRGTKEDDKLSEASRCIHTLYNWAVAHRCMLLCKSLRKYVDKTCLFDALPNFTEQLMQKFMLVACKGIPTTLCIADKEITKEELLRFFVKQGSRCNYCTPLVECGDDECLRYLLRERVLDLQQEWGFWNLLHTAASEGDTLLCNCDFVKLIMHPTEDTEITKENEGLAEFAVKVRSLKDESDASKRHLFLNCIETIGLNQSLIRALQLHRFSMLSTNEKGHNGLHVAVKSTLPYKRVMNTITVLALAELDLQQGVNKDGETPLMMAVQLPHCHIQCIAELLRQNANPNFASPDSCYTALHLCIMSPLDDDTVSRIVSTLIAHNADITKRSLSGETPISLAISKGKSRLKTLGSLVKGRDSHAHATQYMLHYCMQLDLADNDKEDVVNVLIREGVSVNQKNDKGLTPIMVAIQKNRDNADLVKQLLDENADVTITDNEGLSPLHYCCKAQHAPDVAVKIAQWLIERGGACIETPDDKRKTPLMHAIMNENHETSELVFDLIERVTDINAVDSGGNTVMHLSMASHFDDDITAEVLDRLMTRAADPFVQNNYSQSSLMCGICSPKDRLKSIFKVLEKTPGDSYRLCKDLRGRNLLHLCVEAADLADEDASTVCKQAIMCGESIYEKSKDGKTALEMAVSSQSERLQTICSILSSTGLKLTCEIYDMLKQANKLSYEFLELLLQHNIDLDEICKESKFPFHDIIDDSQTEADETIVLSLVRLGFDIDKTNARGESAFMSACRRRCSHAILVTLGRVSDLTKSTNENETYLHLLSKSNRTDLETRDAMKSLMGISPANVNQLSRKHRSALAESVIKQKKFTVQFLKHNGADHNQKDRAGKTVIHHCVEGDWFDDKACAMLDILIEGNDEFDDILDNSKASALNLASSHASRSRLFTILRLLELGSDIETIDHLGKSPIQNCLTHLRGHRKSAVLERACRLTMLRLYGVHPFSKDDEGNTAVYICDKPEWRDRLEREKQILMANMVQVPALFEEIVKSSFASLNANDTFSHIDYPVQQLTPRSLELMKYASKLLHREEFDVCEDEEDFETLSDYLEIREFEAR